MATDKCVKIEDMYDDYFLDSDVAIVNEEVVGNSCQVCQKDGMDDDEAKAHDICHMQQIECENVTENYIQNKRRATPKAKAKKVQVSHIKCTVSKFDSNQLIYTCSLCGGENINIAVVSAHMQKKCVINADISDAHVSSDISTNSRVVAAAKDEAANIFNANCIKHFGSDNIIEEIVSLFDPLASDIGVSKNNISLSENQLLEGNALAEPKTVSKQSLVSCIVTAGDNTSIRSALVYESFGPDDNSFRHLMENTKVEDISLFKCHYCEDCFASENELLTHQEILHPDQHNNLLCLICGKSYTKKQLLKRHVETHEMDLATCSVCNKTFHNKMMLKTHTMMHTGKHPFKCSMCDNGFIFSSSLKQHLFKEHKVLEKDYPCSICTSAFKTKLGLKKHQEREHAGVGNQHLCPHCGKIFSTSSALSLHMTTHGPRKHICEICGFRFYSKYQFKKHMVRHQSKKNIICEMCGDAFYHSTELRSHIFNQHTDDLPSKCTHCPKAFKFPHRLQRHMIFAHRIIPEGKQVFSCKICNQLFVNKLKMNDHMNLHSGARPYSCTECSLKFRNRHSLAQHREVHAVVRKPKNSVPCDICGRKFKNERTCRLHKQSYHLSDTEKVCSLACNECDKAFSTIWMLNRHNTLSHSDVANEGSRKVVTSSAKQTQQKLGTHLVEDSNNKLFQCNQCEKVYNTRTSLYQHNVLKHKPARMYPCKVCGKLLKSASALSLHGKCKHGINARDYTCDVCSRNFKLKAHLKKHKLTHIDIKDREVFTCNICFKDLTTKWSFEVHKRVHMGIKPHACDICGRTFTQSGDRNKHRMNAHKELLAAKETL